MNEAIMQEILQKIEQYDRVLLFTHTRPDGDCLGAARGLQAIIRDSFPGKEAFTCGEERAQYLAFLGENDPPLPDDGYRAALAIALDTASADRISDPRFALCREIVKIDHHPNNEPYGNLVWVEEEISSACEMIVKFYETFRDCLTLSRRAAECLFTGMVTDSGRFRYDGVNGDTLRRAAVLLDRGIDTERLYAHLYLSDAAALRFKAYVYERMEISENGVASIIADRETQARFGLSFEDACVCISYLDGIAGSLIWLAFIEDIPNHLFRVRLRSRFVTVDALAMRHEGGGHSRASGATAQNMQEIRQIIAEADELSKEYKASHTDWL